MNTSFWFRHSEFMSGRKRNLTKREVARICGQLKMLLASGVPLLEALRIVRNLSRHKEFDSLIQKISEGESLARAMHNYFPPLVTSSIEGAERAGNLEEVLARLSRYYEERAVIEERIKSALIYPSFVVALCLLSLMVLLLLVLPEFKTLFADLDADLPLFTRVLMDLGENFSKIWYVPFFVLPAFWALSLGCQKSEKGALLWDGAILKFKFLAQAQIIQGFRTLGSLLQGGIPMVDALNTTASSTSNKAFQRMVFEIKEAIEEGERLSVILSGHKIFPKESIQMIGVGENSGRLAEMLLNTAEFYENEREVFVKRFTIILEPALTLIVGVMVGIIAVGMFLPMVNMISRLQ